MKSKFLLAALLVLAPAFAAAPETPGTAKSAEAVKRHPLRGVITAVLADQSALMVKHEAIPGVMRAMTMMFKVDAATLKSAQPGQAITGMLTREDDGWWLRDVKPAEEKKS